MNAARPAVATLLPVPIRKDGSLSRDTVNAGRFVAHHAHVVRTDIELADVIAPDHKDVGLLCLSVCLCHRSD